MIKHHRLAANRQLQYLQAILCLLIALISSSPGALQESVLAHLKNATVFIKTEQGTGSGFLIYRQHEDQPGIGLVATNQHVIADLPSPTSKIEVVFHSGSSRERVLPATLVAQLENEDLALLKIEAFAAPLPLPIPPTDPKLRETQELYVAGFPFGEAIGTRNKHPEITITPGTVSALRRGEDALLDVIQLNCDLNPGNSGGPLITADGALSGIAVATLMGTQVSWAIPVRHLNRLIQPSAGPVTISLERITEQKPRFQASTTFQTPLDDIAEATLLLTTATGNLPEPGPGGTYAELPEVIQAVPMHITGTQGAAVITPDWQADEGSRPFLVQVKLTTGNGKVYYSAPSHHEFIVSDQSAEVRTTTEGKGTTSMVLDLDTGLRVVPLRVAGTDFAIDPETGNLAAVEFEQATVRLYSRSYLETGQATTTLTAAVGTSPISIVYKKFGGKGFFIIGCYDDANLYILDATTLQEAARVPTGLPQISQVSAIPNPQDPWVYFAHSAGHGSAVHALDLRTNRVTPAFGDAMDFAHMPDGRYFYRRGPWSPSGFESLERTHGNPPSFKKVHREHRSVPPYVADSLNTYVATGRDIYNSKLTQKVATMHVTPILFHPTQAGILGLREDELVIASRNTFQVVNYVVLPQALREALKSRANIRTGGRQADFKRLAQRVRLLPCPTFESVVLAAGDAALVIPDKVLGLEREPLLHTKLEGPKAATVGQPVTISVTKLDSRISNQLSLAPAGAQFNGSTITWTPDRNQLGEQRFSVISSYGKLQTTQELTIQVRPPSFSLPLVATHLVVNPAGDRASAWGTSKGQHTLCLLDTTTGDIIGTTTLSNDINAVALDSNRVYVALQDSATVLVYDITDLTLAKRLFAPQALTSLQLVGDHGLLGQAQAQGGTTETIAWQLPALTRQPALEHPAAPVAPDHWLIGGGLYHQADLQTLLLPQHPPYLLTPSPGKQGQLVINQPRSRPPISGWDCYVVGRILRGGNRLIANLSGQAVFLPDHQGLLELVGGSQQAGHRVQPAALRLNLRNLRDGTIITEIPLTDRPATTNHPPVLAGNRVLVLQGSTILYADLAEEHLAKLKAPPTIRPQLTTFFLQKDQPLTIQHQLLQGTGDSTYDLIHQLPGYQLDRATGTLAIDTPALLQQLLPELRKMLSQNQPRTLHELEVLFPKSAGATDAFRHLYGRQPDGLPIALPIHLRAHDSQGLQATLSYHLILEIAPDDLYRAPPTTPQATPQPQPKPPPATTSSSSESERLRALEERISRLEAQVELLTELLRRN